MRSTAFPLTSTLLDQKRKQLAKRLSVEINQKQLFKRLDDMYELTGARIVYIDYELTDVVLREFEPGCRNAPLTLILREPPQQVTATQYAAKLKENQRESQLVGELVGLTLSCGAAVLSWIVVFGSLGAIPLTGGASAAVTYLGYAAAGASTAQCFNGMVRTGLELGNHELKDWLDSNEWYSNISLAVDAISLAGAGASSVVLLKTLKLTKASSSRSILEILKGLTRAERKRLTQEVIKLNHPGVSAKVMKSLISAGKYPKRFSSGQISAALALKVEEAIGASFSFLGSATSGAARSLAVGVYEQTIDL